MEFAKSILEGFLNVLAGLGALVLVVLASIALIRLSIHALPAAARFAWSLGLAVGAILKVALFFLARIVPLLVRVLVMGVVIYATLHGAGDAWQAYGADVPALIPAVMLILMSCAAGFVGRSWGALLASGGAAYGIGALALGVDFVTRSLLIVGALAVIVAHQQFTRNGDSNHAASNEIEQRVYQTDQDWPDRVHDDPIDRSGAIDFA